MRTFSCFTFDKIRSVPTLTFILTSSLERARVIARRELIEEGGVRVEICEGQQVLWTEEAEES
jgi:hypothetical protein